MITEVEVMTEVMEEHSESPIMEENKELLDDPMEGGLGGGEEDDYDMEYDEFRKGRGGSGRGGLG